MLARRREAETQMRRALLGIVVGVENQEAVGRNGQALGDDMLRRIGWVVGQCHAGERDGAGRRVVEFDPVGRLVRLVGVDQRRIVGRHDLVDAQVGLACCGSRLILGGSRACHGEEQDGGQHNACRCGAGGALKQMHTIHSYQ